MRIDAGRARRGFTLIELLTALLVLSLLALMSFRGLDAVLDTRERVQKESEKWKRVTNFFVRFERDTQLASPRPIRTGSDLLPAWQGHEGAAGLEFSRFAADDNTDAPQRLAYRLNGEREIELWLWPGLDMPSTALPLRYPVLTGVESLDLRYLNADLGWVASWPSLSASNHDAAIPRAVRLRIVLATGEELVRVFSLRS